MYSLGCVLFEALTGRPPYRRENELATLWAHMYTARRRRCSRSRPDLPAQFDDVVQRAMAKDPAQRYATAGELGAAVHAAAHGQMAPAPGEGPARSACPRRTGRPRRWPETLATGGRLLAGVAAGLVVAAPCGGRRGCRIG